MERFEPMLAKKYVPKLTTFPAVMQPKFNGYRCIVTKDDCWTRLGNDHKPGLVNGLFHGIQEQIPEHWALDGEIYCHGVPLQDIISLGKNWRDESSCLYYVVYDMYSEVEPKLPLCQRLKRVDELVFNIKDHRLHDSPHNLALKSSEVDYALQHWAEAGYEGVIIRQPQSPYHFGRHGRDLQKFKKWDDAEWVITDITEGQGKAEGTPVFHCQSITGKPFKVCMNGDYRYLHKLWRNRNHIKGKLITIRYNELSKDKCPKDGRGIAIRDYE